MLHIRPALDTDIDAVGRVHALSRGHAYADLVPAAALARVTPEAQAAVWRERHARKDTASALLVALDGRDVVGFAHGVGPGAGAPGGAAELAAIHVLPDRLGSGAGPALHDAVVDAFRSWGCERAELWVLRGNERAQAFYRRRGWAHDGTASSHDVGGVDVPILRYVLSL